MKLVTIVGLIAGLSTLASAQDPFRGQSDAAPNPPKGKPPVTISVNGTPVVFTDVQPQPIAGRMMVPLRGMFESLGIYVEYDPALRTVTARKGNEDVELRMGEKVAHKNGIEISLDVAPLMMSGHTMVPLRFIVETLGGKVDFNPATNHIDIATSVLDGTPPNL